MIVCIVSLYDLVSRPIVGLCATKRGMQRSKVIPDDPVDDRSVNRLLERLAGSGEHGKGQWAFLLVGHTRQFRVLPADLCGIL